MPLKAFQLKYRNVPNNREAIKGTADKTTYRTRKWNGPRGKNLTGAAKRLARLVFDRQVRAVLKQHAS